MSGSGRETLPAVWEWWEAHPDVRGCRESIPEVREAILEVCEWSGHPLDVPERWESLLDVRQLSGGPPGCAEVPPSCPGVVGGPPGCPGGPLRCLGVLRRPSRMS